MHLCHRIALKTNNVCGWFKHIFCYSGSVFFLKKNSCAFLLISIPLINHPLWILAIYQADQISAKVRTNSLEASAAKKNKSYVEKSGFHGKNRVTSNTKILIFFFLSNRLFIQMEILCSALWLYILSFTLAFTTQYTHTEYVLCADLADYFDMIFSSASFSFTFFRLRIFILFVAFFAGSLWFTVWIPLQ